MYAFFSAFSLTHSVIIVTSWLVIFRILRQVGQSGDASVSWEITSRSGGSTPASTFNATLGRIDLPTGVDKVLLPIQVSCTEQHNQAFLKGRGLGYGSEKHGKKFAFPICSSNFVRLCYRKRVGAGKINFACDFISLKYCCDILFRPMTQQ